MTPEECAVIAQVIPVLFLVIAPRDGFLHDRLARATHPGEVFYFVGPILAILLSGVFLFAEYLVIVGAGQAEGLQDNASAGLVRFSVVSLLAYVWVDFVFRFTTREQKGRGGA